MQKLPKGEHANGLRNCPFCGKHGPVSVWTENDLFSVVCAVDESTGGCGAMGGWHNTEQEARDVWNRRTAYVGKGDFEKLGWPYNLVTDVVGTDDSLNGVELTEDQITGLEYVLKDLTDREQRCVLRYYRDEIGYDEIGKEQHVTRERIRQVIIKGLRKLRHPAKVKYIKQGYTIASGQVAETARATYQAEVDKVKREMFSEIASIREKLDALAPDLDNVSGEIADSKQKPMTIDEMELSVRPYNCLRRALGDAATVVDVLAVEEPGRIRNLGLRSAKEIADKLVSLGYDVKGTGWELFAFYPKNSYTLNKQVSK